MQRLRLGLPVCCRPADDLLPSLSISHLVASREAYRICVDFPFDGVPLPDDGAAPIGQGDNAFVFPVLGAGAVCVGATKITDNMVMEGGYTVAE